VLHAPAHRMLAMLRASRADPSHEKNLPRYTSADPLLIDDARLGPLDAGEPLDLYEVIQARGSRDSLPRRYVPHCGHGPTLTSRRHDAR
jgi:hypothetical protein